MEKYVKADKIGEGSFGVAFLARLKGSNKQVVLKEINLTKMTKKESDEARKEVAVLAQLKHCNVVSYLESFELNGNLYIVMDFCDGGDLFGRINAQHGTLFPEEQVLDWFVQMCFAVKHIHDRKILHRDIKSQNIFLTKSGIIKLGDFGIAKVLNSTVELARTCIGTPYYLSPEICEAKPYNNKSDIWSLGCVLYELMTLKHAFEAPSMKALVLNIVRGLYTPPSSKYCADLRNLIATMFKKSPRERPSVTTILKKPLLQATIQNLLSKLEIAEEFNRTAMQGAKAQQAIQSVQARPLPPRPIVSAIKDKQPQSPYAQRYNPAAVYGPSVACRRSRDNLGKDSRKSSEVKKSVPQDKPNVRRPSSSGNSRPPSVGPVVQDPAKRRQEFNEKENERRKEILRKVDVELQKQHRLLLERQKAARISKNREDGWRSVLDSSNSEEKDPAVGVNGNVVREIGNYDHHLAQLRKLEERSQEPVSVPQSYYQRPGDEGASPVKKCNQPSQNAGGLIGDRIQIYQEFMKRKEAAAFNRVRAQGGGMPLPLNVPSPVKPAWSVAQTPNPVPSSSKPSWAVALPPSPIPSSARPMSALTPPATPLVPPAAPCTPPRAKQGIPSTPPSDNTVPVSSPSGVRASKVLDEEDEEVECITHEKILPESPAPVPYNERPSSARVWEDEKKKQNEEYESKLRQIRLQNFNERYLREIKAAQIRGFSNVFGNKNEKLKELELIRAAVRAKRFKEEHRRESEERRLQENKLQDPEPMMRPFDALPIRAVQGKIPSPSVGMTSAMVAIGASKQEPHMPESERAQAKKSILKRVNMSFSESEDEPAKGKWAKAGVTRVLGQMELEEEGKWKNAGVTDILDKMNLEESQPCAKEVEGIVSTTCGKIPDESPKEVGALAAANPRKQWPAQRGTVVNILSNAVICEATRGASIAIKSAKSNINESDQQAAEPETSNDDTTGDALLSDDCNCSKPESDVLVEPAVILESKTSKDSERVEDLEDNVRTMETMEEARQDDEDKNVSEDLNVAHISSDEPQKAVDEDDDQLKLDAPEEVQQHAEGEAKLFLPRKGFGLKESLTAGKYDALDVKLLRTCSEPDLHKLLNSKALVMDEKIRQPTKSSGDIRDEEVVFKEDATNQEMTNEVGEIVEDVYDIIVTDLSLDELNHSVAVCEDDDSLRKSLDQESESCDIDETGFESEDSDLRTLRESMANILANNVEVSDEELTVQVTKTKKKTKKGKCSKKGKKRRSRESSNEEAITNVKVWASSSFDDFESMKETMRSLLQSTKPSSIAAVREKPKLPLSAIVESAAANVSEGRDSRVTRETVGLDTTLIPISNESVDSDFDRVDDEYFEDEGIFARLEGMRASLEDQLGCETFLKAYTTVQAFQEEDEDMEEGIKMVTRILGPDNVYLYPSILQLVMADASFSG